MANDLIGSGSKTFTTNRRRFLQSSGAIGAGLLAPGFLSSIANAASTDTITYGLSAYPPNLRPFDWSGQAALTVKALLFRGLLCFDEKGGIQPELAESWEQTDPKTYRFTLRSNAKFQNGEPVTADDVKASFDAIRGEKSTAYVRQAFQAVDTIEVVDPKTVRIVLKEPTPSFILVIAGQMAPIVFGKKMDNPDAMIGAGPYRLESSEKGVSLTFKARTDFYKPGLPKTNTVRFVAYPDESLRIAALNAGDVDIIEYVPWQSMKSLSQTKGLNLQTALGSYMYVVFNLKEGPFTDPRIRRAVAHAVKREDIVNAAFSGFGKVLDGMPFPEGSPYAVKELEHLWPYDPDRAKSLLKEAGAQNLQATLLSTSTYSFHKDIAEVMQQHLAAVGMQVKLSLPEWGVRVSQGNEGRYHFAINGGSGDLGDPDDLTALFGSDSNSYRRSFGLSDPKLDDLLNRGRHESDTATRVKIYTDLQKEVAQTAPVTFLNLRAQGWGLRDRVKDFVVLSYHMNNQVGMAFDTAYIA
jgi:peptide/nickel transport system substrate-binding protein